MIYRIFLGFSKAITKSAPYAIFLETYINPFPGAPHACKTRLNASVNEKITDCN